MGALLVNSSWFFVALCISQTSFPMSGGLSAEQFTHLKSPPGNQTAVCYNSCKPSSCWRKHFRNILLLSPQHQVSLEPLRGPWAIFLEEMTNQSYLCSLSSIFTAWGTFYSLIFPFILPVSHQLLLGEITPFLKHLDSTTGAGDIATGSEAECSGTQEELRGRRWAFLCWILLL